MKLDTFVRDDGTDAAMHAAQLEERRCPDRGLDRAGVRHEIAPAKVGAEPKKLAFWACWW